LNSIYNYISINIFKLIFLILFSISWLIYLPIKIFSQTDTSGKGGDIVSIPGTVVNNLVKYSVGIVKNNYNHDGKVFGYKDGESKFITDFKSQETFSFETGNYDSIQLFYEWDLDDEYKYVVDKFFLKISENFPFTFLPITVLPIIESDGLNMIIKSVAKSKGKKLYEIKISDDVDPKQIEVTALDESLPFIDIKKGDSATYYIFLKEKDDFNNNASTELLENIKKGQEVIIPIGVIMKDKVVSSDIQPYKQYLKKKKKPKPKS